MNQNALVTFALQNWKSTVSGLLTVGLTTTAALLAYPPVMANPKWVVIGGGIQVVLKIWVSILQQDAGTTVAQVPGEATPQVVPSHEVPNDPSHKAIA